MKTGRFIFTMLSVCLLAGTTLTSCLDEENSASDRYLWAYVTVGELSADNVYTLYPDGGGVIYPSASSVYSLTGAYNGLSEYERCYIYMSYTESNYSTDADGLMVICGGTMKSGLTVAVDSVLTLEEATAAGVNAEDSIFSASALNGFWGYRGYLTAVTEVGYCYATSGAIEPTQKMVCDSIKTDSLFVSLYNNRHVTQGTPTYGTASFLRSYRLTDFQGLIPGSDSIVVKMNLAGTTGATIKIGREDLFLPTD